MFRRVSPLIIAILAASCVGMAGCSPNDAPSQAPQDKQGGQPSGGNRAVPPKERALAARDALFARLSTELMAAMSSGGPSAAIEVCSRKAPKIAAEVSREHKLSIGRTSFKLRNPKNQPPAWAVQLVEQRVREPQFVELDNQATGALLPIFLKGQCLICHGPADQIEESVKKQLADRYPEDQATGFQNGDLRGWFWVEVPAATSGDNQGASVAPPSP